jgi:hypothetical protein
MPSRSSVPDRLPCSHCGAALRATVGGRLLALLVGIAGMFVGLHLCWRERGGLVAFLGGALGFIIAGLLGGIAFLRLERDSP